jgi:hypothetical protein
MDTSAHWINGGYMEILSISMEPPMCLTARMLALTPVHILVISPSREDLLYSSSSLGRNWTNVYFNISVETLSNVTIDLLISFDSDKSHSSITAAVDFVSLTGGECISTGRL